MAEAHFDLVLLLPPDTEPVYVIGEYTPQYVERVVIWRIVD